MRYIYPAIFTVSATFAECAVLDDNKIETLQWVDGITAVVFSILWIFRQMLLTAMYNGAYIDRINHMYYICTLLSLILLFGTLVFIIVAVVLGAPNEVAYQNTLIVFVGFAISVVLDKRKQFSILNRVKLISRMLAKNKFRIGKLTLRQLSAINVEDVPTGLFKITRQKIPKNAITENVKWSGLKYKIEDNYYVQDWNIQHRIYGMNPEDFAKHMGKHGEWRYYLLEASLSIGWLPSYYINSNLFKHLRLYAESNRSIRTSIPTWKGQVVGLHGIYVDDLNRIIGNESVQNILGLYTLALMETPDEARKWLSNCEKHLEHMYKCNVHLNSICGDVRELYINNDDNRV